MQNNQRGAIFIDISDEVKGKILRECVMEDTYEMGNVWGCGYTYHWKHSGEGGVVKRTVREDGKG